ncbi:helix-turn-helix domain-containing protein [Enterobacter sp. E76]|nr:helix-turn-helix domain-containing protein [Enterobacter sp. E76]
MNHVIEKAINIAGSQSDLAKQVGVGQSTVSKWLNGSEISSRYISALVKATNGEVTTEEILKSLASSSPANPNQTAA